MTHRAGRSLHAARGGGQGTPLDRGTHGRRGRHGRGDQGMATAELAVVLPSLVALVLAATGLVAAAETALRCEDAARIGARSAARGDPATTSVALARAEAPRGAVIGRVVLPAGAVGGALVRVSVSDRVRLLGPLGALLPAWTVTGSAAALAEDSP